jgi:hypothetical protein
MCGSSHQAGCITAAAPAGVSCSLPELSAQQLGVVRSEDGAVVARTRLVQCTDQRPDPGCHHEQVARGRTLGGIAIRMRRLGASAALFAPASKTSSANRNRSVPSSTYHASSSEWWTCSGAIHS